MKTKRLHLVTGILLGLVLAGLVAAPVSAKPSNKWRIEVSEGANSDGEIVFRVEPVGGQPMEVRVAVKDGTRENAVARTIRDAMQAQLPKDGYHVEVGDGEDVLVKAKGGAANFDLNLIDNTVKSVRINLDGE
jgi:hypothetical protein